MDAKEVLRLAIQHRFWITVGVAVLLTIIGPLVTLGSINEKITAKTTEIEGAKSGAQKYASGTFPNNQYTQYTDERIKTITKDVNSAWRRLYERQAPLLDWPENVQEEFAKWGREFPKEESQNFVQAVAIDYTRGYEDFTKKVYQTFKPWDPQEGTGIVVAPPRESLLLTQTFDINDPPTLTKIWQIQDNLWVRRAILDVVAKVNEKANAKDWESAPIKQINRLEVGNKLALDHRSLAKGETLKDPTPLEPDAASTSSAPPPPAAGDGGARGMMEGMGMSELGYGSSAGASTKNEPVKYLQPDGVDQYRIYPAMISVLIDQNHIQDFLVEFANSPMSIQVKEVNWNRPQSRVKAPVKGEAIAGLGGMGAYGMMGMGGGLFGGGGRGMMMGGEMEGMYGGMYGGNSMMGGGRGSMMGGMEGMGMGMGGRGAGGNAFNQPRTKVSRLDEVKKGLSKKDDEKEEQKTEKVEIFDPYFNIVELQVYTQARFYEPPPTAEPEAPATESPGEAVAAESAEDVAEPGAESSDATPAEALPTNSEASQVDPASNPENAGEPNTNPAAGEPASPPPATPETTEPTSPPEIPTGESSAPPANEAPAESSESPGSGR